MRNIFLALPFLALAPFGAAAQENQPSDPLYPGFLIPGNASQPRVWWHWMNGNITKEGIRKDLLWMKSAGVGGFQTFDASLMTPQITEKRLVYMTPEWKETFAYAVALADSLGLEIGIAGSPGWSESGGPWVPEKDGMKKLVWSETRVEGGKPLAVRLPHPPKTTGDFQNTAYTAGFGAPGKTEKEFYGEAGVVAFKLHPKDLTLKDLGAKVSSSGGIFSLEQLTDGDLATTTLLPSDLEKGTCWIQFEFPELQSIKGITLVGGGTRWVFGLPQDTDDRVIEASDDGVNFRRISLIPLGIIAQQTVSFPEARGRYFRIIFKNPAGPNPLLAMFGGSSEQPKGHDIAEIVLHPVTRINHFEEKAAFASTPFLERYATPSSGEVVTEVLDLTQNMASDGTLTWTPPAGNWKILRFGYSLTGKENHPASPEATGLEVDKINRQAVRDYFVNYLDQYKSATAGLMGNKGLGYMVTDSYESGANNWTPGLDTEFERRRGYSLSPWMPVLTGVIVNSTEESEKFLWDYRKTISELIVENHYDQLTDILAEYGMKRYTESHENGRVFVMDGMDVKRNAAIPMSAIWMPGGGSGPVMSQADIRESASVAHIYGQNIAAAESLTAMGFGGNAWAFAPQNLKPTADLELANGLNRFVIHTSVHQPVDDKVPGLGLGPFGQWFNRHETWANYASAWTNYLSRSSFLLQQGHFVADIVYYYGEDNNITGLFGEQLPEIPEGYNYDFINAHALVNLLEVKDGTLSTPSGMGYRLLHLDKNAERMSLQVLRKIHHLARNGAKISGTKPIHPAGRMDDPGEFRRLVAEVWEANLPNVLSGKSPAEAVGSLSVPPDFSFKKDSPESEVLFVHRKLADREIYWVNHRADIREPIQASFRVSGKTPEIWNPDTGEIRPVSYRSENGRTLITLDMEPWDAFFVVFRENTTKKDLSLPTKTEKVLLEISQPWKVSFQPERGAPADVTFNSLASWTENQNPGIRYFSGTATYETTLTLRADALENGAEISLDLGEVKELAEVIVNGKPLGTLWKAPFRINATDALKVGENQLEIKVTNLWVNRLIGDMQPGVTEKITYTTMPFHQADGALKPSGLLGPVKLVQRK